MDTAGNLQDISGRGHTAIKQGTGTSLVTRPSGRAIDFPNSSSDYYLPANGDDFEHDESFSILAIVTPDTESGTHSIVTRADAEGANHHHFWFNQVGTTIQIGSRIIGGSWESCPATNVVTAGTELVAIGAWDVPNTDLRIYIEGLLKNTVGVVGGFAQVSDTTYIGNDKDGQAWDGQISLLVYFKGLAIADVMARSLSINPWQLIVPQLRLIPVGAAAAPGGTIHEASLAQAIEMDGTYAVIATFEAALAHAIQLNSIATVAGVFGAALTQAVSLDATNSAVAIFETALAQAVEMDIALIGDGFIEGALSVGLEMGATSATAAIFETALTVALQADYTPTVLAVLEAAFSQGAEFDLTLVGELTLAGIEAAISFGLDMGFTTTVQAAFEAGLAQGVTVDAVSTVLATLGAELAETLEIGATNVAAWTTSAGLTIALEVTMTPAGTVFAANIRTPDSRTFNVALSPRTFTVGLESRTFTPTREPRTHDED